MRILVLLILVTILHSIPAFGATIEEDLECLGKNARQLWSAEVTAWTNGTGYLPNLAGNLKPVLKFELSRARFCDSQKYYNRAQELQRSGHFLGDKEFNLNDELDLVSNSNSLESMLKAIYSGELSNVYGENNTAFLRRYACWSPSMGPECETIINRLLGIYIVIERLKDEFILKPTDRFPMDRILTAVIGRLGEAQVQKGEIVKFRLLNLSHNYSLRDLNVLKGSLSDIVSRIKDRPQDAAIVNLWRAEFAVIEQSTKYEGEYGSAVGDAADDMFKTIGQLSSISQKPKQDQTNMDPKELYSQLLSLNFHFKKTGQLEKSDLVKVAMGELRTSSEELTPSIARRWGEKIFWGWITNYGTSFSKVFLIGSLLLTVSFCLILVNMAIDGRTTVECLIAGIDDSFSLMMLQGISSKIPTPIALAIKIPAFIYVTSAAAYLLMYLSNAQV